VLSGGRLILGLGTGSDRAEHAAFGVPFGSAAERAAGLRRTLRVIRAMAAAPDGASLPGTIERAPNRPAPVQRPCFPVWLAAHRPRLLRLAGEEADGVVAAFVGPDEVARRRGIAEEAREAAGRPPLAFALYTYALPVASSREVEAWLRPGADALGTTPARLLRWVRTTGIVGAPGEVREALQEHARAGVTDAILVLPDRAPDEAIDALAEAVLAPAPASPPALRGASRPCANLVHLLVERHREDGHGGHTAALDEDGEWTYDELGEAAAAAAGALAERGVRRGDRVVVALRDGRPWCAAFLGAARLGAVPVPVDPLAPQQRLAEVVADCEPAAIVAEEGAPPGVAIIAPDELAEGAPEPLAAVHPEDLAYLVYSSGSTGRAKAAMHAHRDLAVSIDGYARQVLGLGPGDRSHSVARLFTSLGFGNGFFRVLGTGGACVLTRARPTVRTVLAAVAERGVTVLTAVPTFWLQLAAFLERHPEAWSAPALRLAVSSGDALPGWLAKRVTELIGVDLIEGLGCSECSNVVLSTRPGERMPGRLGRATPGVEVKLADDEGREVPPGEPGRLWIASDSNTSGYWRRAQETRALLFGRWLRLGDVLVERDGVYRHLGRADDLFKVDGSWVSPVEVEGVLLEHPAVAEAAVVGRPDEAGLLRPAAVVVVRPGVPRDGRLAAELRRHVAHRLSARAAPSWVVTVEELPRLPSGKLDRGSLRRTVAAGG
jgi:acyl-coenzyme A synthetase/AMP-(fatty) acid ligase